MTNLAALLALEAIPLDKVVLLGSELAVPLGLADLDEEPDALGAVASAPGVETGTTWREKSAVIVEATVPP